MVLLTRLLLSVTDKKSHWDRPATKDDVLATKDDVFNAMVVFVVTVSLGLITGFTFLI